MQTRALRILLGAVLLASLLATFLIATGAGWQVRTSLLDLLPKGQGKIRDILTLVEGRTGRELILLVGHPDAAASQSMADAVRQNLSATGTLEAADDQAPEGMQAAWYTTLVPRLPRMLPDSLALAADRGDTALLARQVISALYLPYSIVPPDRDPFQIASQRLSSLSRPGWSLCGRRPCRIDGDTTWTMVRLRLSGGAFDADLQARLMPVLATEQARLSQAGGVLLAQGVVLHATYGRESTQGDMSRVGIGSAVGILLLLWLAFRSPMPFLAGAGCVVVGLGAGVVLTHAVFGGIHTMTLAFGASITGLCSDYALFLLVRRAFEGGQWKSEVAVRTHFQPLLLALLTTLLSFVGLAASGFPGLQEIAVFSLTGLTTSWLCAVVLLPLAFRSASVRMPSTLAALSRTGGVARLTRLRTVIGVAALLSTAGLWKLQGDDDVRRLQKPSDSLMAQDARVSKILQGAGSGPLLLVEASTPESLLVRLEALDSTLGVEKSSGRITDWISLSRTVPSLHRQARDSLRTERLLSEPLRSVPLALGLEPSALDSFAALSRRGVAPLPLRDWLKSDASWGARDLLVDTLPWRAAVSVDGAGESWTLAQVPPGTVQIQTARLYTDLLQGQRSRSAWLVAGMYLLVLLALWVSMGFRRAIAVLVPPVLAGAATLGLLGWCGVPLHFFGLMALTLVLGAGVDYALFLEAKTSEDEAGYASVVLCGATAFLSFGVLWLASSPALSQFGLVTTVGLFWSMLLAPWAPRLSRGNAA